MGILEIVKAEIDNTEITLYKEGIFLRAYEHSAYLFVNQIKEYSITKKYYKNAKQEVVYIGFPQNSFSNIENCPATKLLKKSAVFLLSAKALLNANNF